MTEVIGPVLKYPGSKWRLTDWIIQHMPPHESYLEPFFGSGAVFFRKSPAKLSTINDLDGDVVNLFRVLRDRPEDLAAAVDLTPYAREEHDEAWLQKRTGEPVEDARRFLVRIWSNHGMRIRRKGGWAHATGRNSGFSGGIASRYPQWGALGNRIAAAAARLKNAQIEHRPALDILARHAYAGCLIYADPPYVLSTRSEAQYAHEMNEADHEELLDALDAHPGPVLLSGYAHALYDGRLEHWERKTSAALAEGGRPREEVLWMNPVAVEALEGRLF